MFNSFKVRVLASVWSILNSAFLKVFFQCSFSPTWRRRLKPLTNLVVILWRIHCGEYNIMWTIHAPFDLIGYWVKVIGSIEICIFRTLIANNGQLRFVTTIELQLVSQIILRGLSRSLYCYLCETCIKFETPFTI